MCVQVWEERTGLERGNPSPPLGMIGQCEVKSLLVQEGDELEEKHPYPHSRAHQTQVHRSAVTGWDGAMLMIGQKTREKMGSGQ